MTPVGRAVVTARLADELRAELEERGEIDLYAEIEAPLVAVLARMEAAGIGVDRAYLEELGESLRDQLATLEGASMRRPAEPFNVNSTKELRHVLYTTLGLPPLKKTSTGVPSTDASVLAKLADAHPMVELLLRYRELEKLRSTYVDGYLPLIGPDGAYPHAVQPDGGHHRAALLRPAKSAEHPDPLRDGENHQAGLRRPGGVAVPRGRLLADRVARLGAHVG